MIDERKMKKIILLVLAWSFLASIVTQNGLFFTSVLMCFFLISPFGIAWYLNNSSVIQRKREKIKNYRPGEWTLKDVGNDFAVPEKIRLGVYGMQGAGKSALLNSLHFAFRGEWRHIYVEGEPGDRPGGETLFRDPVRLTDYITTFDTRGLRDFSAYRAQDVMEEIRGKRGIDPGSRKEGEKIDCPIFVLGYKRATGINICGEFIRTFLPHIRTLYGAYPIMVITFADEVDDKELVLRELSSAGMDKTSVFFIENYTVEKHEMDGEKHIALLKILEACILRADDNITFEWRGERERANNPPWWIRFCRMMRSWFR